ncbi:MAG: glycosyltransferase [Flavobacteriales bacterium]
MPLALLYVFLAAAFLQALIWLLLFGRYAFRRAKEHGAGSVPVSVVVAARNESENLLNNLPALLEQDYPEFEVVVVDDCSWDDTGEVLRAFSSKYKHFRTAKVDETDKFFGGKKFAVTMGVKAAKHDIIVLTDADCRPASKLWLSRIAGHFTDGKEIVLGYGGYEPGKGILNALVRFDAFMIALQYFSFTLSLRPYMGVGRNMAWRRELFFRNRGFASHSHLVSGDDDLFVNETAGRSNTAICDSSEAHTISTPPASFAAWIKQKSRHLSTWPRYRLYDKLMLGLLMLSPYFFILSFCALIICSKYVYLILIIFACRIFIQMLIFIRAMKKLGCGGLAPFGFLLELLMLVLNPVFMISSATNRRKRWTR